MNLLAPLDFRARQVLDIRAVHAEDARRIDAPDASLRRAIDTDLLSCDGKRAALLRRFDERLEEDAALLRMHLHVLLDRRIIHIRHAEEHRHRLHQAIRRAPNREGNTGARRDIGVRRAIDDHRRPQGLQAGLVRHDDRVHAVAIHDGLDEEGVQEQLSPAS